VRYISISLWARFLKHRYSKFRKHRCSNFFVLKEIFHQGRVQLSTQLCVRDFFANSTRESTQRKLNRFNFLCELDLKPQNRISTRASTQLYANEYTQLYAIYYFSSFLLIGYFNFQFAYSFWINQKFLAIQY